ncbi:MAG: rRNA maturation RNase YbeY [Candidatus Magasanikbacteria bacterium]|nr:rRNA maturation RNase YbeY [Candidatus Magasanikbacteria bacterium]
MELNIYSTVSKPGLSEKKIQKIVEMVFKNLKKTQSKTSIHFVGSDKMKSLNKRFRAVKKDTDVLAFTMNEGDKMPIRSGEIGDIFISVPYVRKNAKKFSVPYKQELSRIIVHGLLHLLGFDHQNKKEAEKMFALQEKMVKKIYENKIIN